MNPDAPLSEEDWKDVQRRLERSSSYDAILVELAKRWTKHLAGCQILSSEGFEELFSSLEDPISWEELRRETRPALKALKLPEEDPAPYEAAAMEFIQGAALAQATPQIEAEPEAALINAGAYALRRPARCAGFKSGLAKQRKADTWPRIERAFRLIAGDLQHTRVLGPFEGEGAAFEEALIKWRTAPSLDPIWYTHRFQRAILRETRTPLLALLEDADPKLYLSLLEDTENPALVFLQFSMLRSAEKLPEVTSLLKKAPKAFSRRPRTKRFYFNGALTAPSLVLTLVDGLSELTRGGHDRDDVDLATVVQNAAQAFGSAIASRRDGLALGLHTMAWLMWRLQRWGRAPRRQGVTGRTIEELLINRLCDAFTAAKTDLPPTEQVDAQLEQADPEVIRMAIETGRSPVERAPRATAYNLLAAYCAMINALRDEGGGIKPRLDAHAEACRRLYRQMALFQQIGSDSPGASRTAEIIARLHFDWKDPCVWWTGLWNELSQQRSRSAYRLGDETGLFDSSRHHLKVGLALIDWSTVSEEPSPQWVPSLWERLLRASLHADHGFTLDSEALKNLILDLFARIGHLTRKGPTDDWPGRAARGLEAIGGDTLLLAAAIDALLLNKTDPTAVIERSADPSGADIRARIRELMAWDGTRETTRRALPKDSVERLTQFIDAE